MAITETYNAEKMGGKKEGALMTTFVQQRDDAKLYFENCIKPRLDRSYKLYISDNSDRAKEIKKWQANVSVPYIHAVVETLKPRILDARPEFTIQGRNEEDQPKASKLQSLADYTWEVAETDKVSEDLVSSSLVYGTGHMQVSWKKDVRNLSFLKTKDVGKKKYEWKKEKRTFYDAPSVEWVDNYSLWYDWHNISAVSKQYWFKRLLLSEEEIKRKYPMADKKRMEMAVESGGGDLTDYASIRTQVKGTQDKITKGADRTIGTTGGDIYKDSNVKMHEVFEWLRPFDDVYAVMVNDVPILKGASMPNPYDFKETFFISVPYLRLPGEFEGYGLPMILENPQIMLNMVKNQRLDAMTLNIHKMWVVNPLANVKKEELVARPYGIIYSPDPNGVREVQSSDIKPSAYKEEELLKGDMRYGSGVDDFSMGSGGGTPSATEVRHLRESTLERVRLFINHLGDGYAILMRDWISMWRQFYTKELIIRITGDGGDIEFPIIAEDDLKGEFDYKATVIPAIAGQNDIKKKQDMDLFQLLINLPFIDPEKLTSKILHDWSWNIKSLIKAEEPIPEEMMAGPEGAEQPVEEQPEAVAGGGKVSPDVVEKVLSMLEGKDKYGSSASPLAELASPVNLLKDGKVPPTPGGVKQATTNPRGLNRKLGGRVNTNVSTKDNTNPEASLENQASSLQK